MHNGEFDGVDHDQRQEDLIESQIEAAQETPKTKSPTKKVVWSAYDSFTQEYHIHADTREEVEKQKNHNSSFVKELGETDNPSQWWEENRNDHRYNVVTVFGQPVGVSQSNPHQD